MNYYFLMFQNSLLFWFHLHATCHLDYFENASKTALATVLLSKPSL
jgi:hypothetical protein